MTKTNYGFGDAMRRAREAAHISQESLAEQLDVSMEHISNLEREVRHPSFDTLYQICQILNLSIDAVFFPEQADGQDFRHKLLRRINQLSDWELEVLLATAEALHRPGCHGEQA